jgi:TolB-like protein
MPGRLDRNPQISRNRGLWALVAAAVLLTTPGLVQLWRQFSRQTIKSMAVLPLRNLSGDTAQDYFAEGVTELLTEELSKRLPLRVVSRTSAARYRETAKSGRTIGSELGVDALIEGSVVRSGDRVRGMVQLIAVASDLHLWAETYDRDLGRCAGASEGDRAGTGERDPLQGSARGGPLTGDRTCEPRGVYPRPALLEPANGTGPRDGNLVVSEIDR